MIEGENEESQGESPPTESEAANDSPNPVADETLVDQPDQEEQAEANEALMPEQESQPGWHVFHKLGHLLGIYPTEEDAREFVRCHHPEGEVRHVEG